MVGHVHTGMRTGSWARARGRMHAWAHVRTDPGKHRSARARMHGRQGGRAAGRQGRRQGGRQGGRHRRTGARMSVRAHAHMHARAHGATHGATRMGPRTGPHAWGHARATHRATHRATAPHRTAPHRHGTASARHGIARHRAATHGTTRAHPHARTLVHRLLACCLCAHRILAQDMFPESLSADFVFWRRHRACRSGAFIANAVRNAPLGYIVMAYIVMACS